VDKNFRRAVYCSETEEYQDECPQNKKRNEVRSSQSVYQKKRKNFLDPTFSRAFKDMFHDKKMIAEILN